MKNPTIGIMMLVAAAYGFPDPAGAQQLPPFTPLQQPPFTATLSNIVPLVFGMDADSASAALHAPLNYISGRPGEETFLAIRNLSGSGFFNRTDRLYLRFRKGRLTGWKGDWGQNWIWQ